MKKILIFLYILIVSTNSISAQKTYAVVVGVADYEAFDYQNGDLRFADADAKNFVEYLKSPTGGSVPNQNIILLTNKTASKAKIMQAMNLYKTASNQDRIIFYFSGHGADQTFIPYDISSDPNSNLTHVEVKTAFKASAAKTKLIIADACFSGSMRNKSNPKKIIESSTKAFNDVNIAMILSSRSTQTSVEIPRLKGGVFTFYLLLGLQGYADFNHNSVVTIKELYRYIAPRVKQGSTNGQAPVFAGKFSDDLELSKLK